MTPEKKNLVGISSDISPNLPQNIVFWAIWFAILNGLVMIQIFAGGGIPSGADHGDPPKVFLAIATGLILVALAIRFVLIPKIEEISRKLVAMIVGLAVSEAIGIIGAFVVGREFGHTRLVFFSTAIVCILSYAPFYAKPAKETGSF